MLGCPKPPWLALIDRGAGPYGQAGAYASLRGSGAHSSIGRVRQRAKAACALTFDTPDPSSARERSRSRARLHWEPLAFRDIRGQARERESPLRKLQLRKPPRELSRTGWDIDEEERPAARPAGSTAKGLPAVVFCEDEWLATLGFEVSSLAQFEAVVVKCRALIGF